MTRFLILALALLAAPALAQTPYETGYYAVSGVAPDDALNIRAAPDADAAIIGELAFDAVNVEVTGREGNWARVSRGEQAGWVSFTYLERADPPLLENGLPAGLSCGGTEPFWSASISDESFDFNAFWAEEESVSYPVTSAPRAYTIGYPVFLMLEGGGVAVLEPRLCSDGMSDMPYGWSLNAVLPGRTDTAYSGCCTLRRE